MMTDDFSIGELAERVGVTHRTIRYYVDEGLLPPPYGAGRQMRFGREHEVRLRVAKALRDLGLTVKAVQKAITTAPIALLEKRLASLSPEASPEQVGEILEELWRLPNLAAPAYQTLVGHVARGEALHRAHYYAEGSPSQWERATLAPGVELHFQRPDDERREAVIRHIILDAQKRLSVFD